MNIKSIPAHSGVSSVKESSDEQRQPMEREEKKKQETAAAPTEEAKKEPTQTPQAADESMRASQPVDSQTVLELLSHSPTAPVSPAKFPTQAPAAIGADTAKKLNRSA